MLRRNARRSARVAHSSHHEAPKGGITRADEITFVCVRVEIIDAARTVGAVSTGNKIAESRGHDRAAIKNRALSDNKSGSGDEVSADSAKHVSAHVKGVVIDPERFVIQELAGIRPA